MKNNIQKIRQNLGLSRKEFSKKLGVDQSTIAHYENFSRYPRLSICYQIIDLARSNGFKIKLEDLLPREI